MPYSEPFRLTVERKINHSNGDVSFISGDHNSANEMHITVNESGAVGFMRNAKGRFKLTYSDDSFQVITPDIMRDYFAPSNALDYRKPPLKLASASGSKLGEQSSPSNSSQTEELVTIDVMVVYNEQIKQRLGSNLQTRINQLVSLANRAFDDSNTNTEIVLVHSELTDYTNNSTTPQALDDLTQGVGKLSGVASLRIDKKADLVILLRDYDASTHSFCGFAWILGANGEISMQQRDFGYLVVQDGISGNSFCLDSTLAHKIGHNLGSLHDRNNSGGGSGILPFSHGHDVSGQFFTVMSLDKNGREIGLFSNPRISCLGLPCGISSSSINSADNALSISRVSAGIGEFFVSKSAGATIVPIINTILLE